MDKKVKSVKRFKSAYETQTQCVLCSSRAVRCIGKDHYFCAECCTEFKVFDNRVSVYSIRPDGGLMKIS
jgi:hypothetical protein